MLSNVLSERKLDLLNFFNHIWETGAIPFTWKLAWAVPVIKPGKDQTAMSSYRPASLTSCVAKLMEKIVCARLTWWLGHFKQLPSCMTGFRQSLSAQDSVPDLISLVEHNVEHNTSAALPG